MDVGIGLPAAIPGVSGASAIKWAQKAETGPFADEQSEAMKRICAGGPAGENAGANFALDGDAKSTGAENIMHYYGAPFGPMTSEGLPDSVDAFKELISGFSDAGCDELILWPTVTDLDQVERLTELI